MRPLNLITMTVFRGFWDKLDHPIIALSPMDGVTDAPFRYLINKHSTPSITFTEFTNVEMLARGVVKGLIAFRYDPIERPIVAQIYGVEVESYYKVAAMLCYLGYDGIDINMGCPANKVARLGSGAALIKTPELAQELVRTTQQATIDWANGMTLKEAGVPEELFAELERMKPDDVSETRKRIPVSVKTRIGFDKNVAEAWTETLLEVEPANISMHGRTLKQLYSGQADWDTIAKAGQLTKGTATSYLGNGDIKTMEQAHEYTKKYDVDGVLIGRAVFGKPWFFSDKTVSPEASMHMAIEHAEFLEREHPDMHFHALRKHLAWYCHHLPGSRQLRFELMQMETAAEVKEKIEGFLANQPTD
jgi:tRNA-dihydrouridine synthase B